MLRGVESLDLAVRWVPPSRAATVVVVLEWVPRLLVLRLESGGDRRLLSTTEWEPLSPITSIERPRRSIIQRRLQSTPPTSTPMKLRHPMEEQGEKKWVPLPRRLPWQGGWMLRMVLILRVEWYEAVFFLLLLVVWSTLTSYHLDMNITVLSSISYSLSSSFPLSLSLSPYLSTRLGIQPRQQALPQPPQQQHTEDHGSLRLTSQLFSGQLQPAPLATASMNPFSPSGPVRQHPKATLAPVHPHKQQPHHPTTTSTSASATSTQHTSPSLSSQQAPSYSSSNLTAASPSKSPFGNARATMTGLGLGGGSGSGGKVVLPPALIPPLVIEPAAAVAEVGGSSNGGGSFKSGSGSVDVTKSEGGAGGKSATTAAAATKNKIRRQPTPYKPLDRKQLDSNSGKDAKSAGGNTKANTTSSNGKDGASQQSPPLTGISVSSESTPVHSNSTLPPTAAASTAATTITLLEVNNALQKSQLLQPKGDEKRMKTQPPTQSTTTATVQEESKERVIRSPNLVRLEKDLLRTEKEKADALEQVAKLNQLLESMNSCSGKLQQYQQQRAKGVISSGGSPASPAVLLDEFKGMVASKGDKEAVAWISQKLEVLNKSSTKRGRGGVGGVDLLSSALPPLTPRSRPGSRAASPERGGVGGLLSSGSLSSMGGRDGRGTPSRGKRIATPVRKRLDGEEVDVEHERVENEFIVAAVKSPSFPTVFGFDDIATFFVRRPHVMSSQDEDSKFNAYTHFSSAESYLQNSSIYDPDSLEVVAYIEADGSVFTLTGKSDVRHGKMPSVAANGSFCEDDEVELDWRVFDDVEESDRSLGAVAYIDGEGNEGEYYLGEFVNGM